MADCNDNNELCEGNYCVDCPNSEDDRCPATIALIERIEAGILLDEMFPGCDF